MNTTNSAQRRRRQQGETRDSQNKRLTTGSWTDATDGIRPVVRALQPLRSQTDALNEWDKALDKMLWYSIFNEGRCYIPLPHWKLMVALTFKAMGGKAVVKRNSPALYHNLARENRVVRFGRTFRNIVERRFNEGVGGE